MDISIVEPSWAWDSLYACALVKARVGEAKHSRDMNNLGKVHLFIFWPMVSACLGNGVAGVGLQAAVLHFIMSMMMLAQVLASVCPCLCCFVRAWLPARACACLHACVVIKRVSHGKAVYHNIHVLLPRKLQQEFLFSRINRM